MIAALAESTDSRLRLSLIPLFLEHPEFAGYVRTAARNLDGSARLILLCYYSAAVWLQELHHPQLDALIGRQPSLPDLFSGELDLKFSSDPETNLEILAKRHQVLGREQVNWLGTYQHAVQVWIKGLEIENA